MGMERLAWLKSPTDRVILARNSVGNFSRIGCNGISISLSLETVARADVGAAMGADVGAGVGAGVEMDSGLEGGIAADVVVNDRSVGGAAGLFSSKCRSKPRSIPANFDFTISGITLMFCPRCASSLHNAAGNRAGNAPWQLSGAGIFSTESATSCAHAKLMDELSQCWTDCPKSTGKTKFGRLPPPECRLLQNIPFVVASFWLVFGERWR